MLDEPVITSILAGHLQRKWVFSSSPYARKRSSLLITGCTVAQTLC